ncbi:TetR/AcrR family transcriptional regulator [Nocardioides sp. NPDC092400]|uniref:TetR/AcrR family transcriptional regulator n=1 Tax=Nocardioides sp. NPDC092400 TaxID=3155196 RepID=UPI00341C7832
MSADARRALLLEAGARAFARAGFHGTTTDAIAKEAGVSQPYVVRMFGTKLELFLEVFEAAGERVRAAFAAVLDEGPFDPELDADWERLGAAYADLMGVDDTLQVLMHGFSAGSVEEIGAVGRRCMDRIYATILATGCTDEQARDFVAHGMLLNVMMSLRAGDHLEDGGALRALTVCTFGDALALVSGDAGVPDGGAAGPSLSRGR